MSVFVGLFNLVKSAWKLFRVKWSATSSALKPVYVGITRQVGPSEWLGLVSLVVFVWGCGLIWFPLAPLCLGLVGMTGAVINARMR